MTALPAVPLVRAAAPQPSQRTQGSGSSPLLVLPGRCPGLPALGADAPAKEGVGPPPRHGAVPPARRPLRRIAPQGIARRGVACRDAGRCSCLAPPRQSFVQIADRPV